MISSRNRVFIAMKCAAITWVSQSNSQIPKETGLINVTLSLSRGHKKNNFLSFLEHKDIFQCYTQTSRIPLANKNERQLQGFLNHTGECMTPLCLTRSDNPSAPHIYIIHVYHVSCNLSVKSFFPTGSLLRVCPLKPTKLPSQLVRHKVQCWQSLKE